jgi:hypothetical protein
MNISIATKINANNVALPPVLSGSLSFLSCSFCTFFAERGARLFRQMRNCSFSLCGFTRFLDVSLCSDPLFSRRHIVGR